MAGQTLILLLPLACVLLILTLSKSFGWKNLSVTIPYTAAGATVEIDQHSVLWPLLLSIIVALLGSVITTYTFLKTSLDRTIDEKPYYRTVIKEYRENTMKRLWRNTVWVIALIILVIGFYILLYYKRQSPVPVLRVILIVLYVLSLFYFVRILDNCIHIEQGLRDAAQKLLDQRLEQIRQFPPRPGGGFAAVLENGNDKDRSDINCPARWLQIQEKKETSPIHLDLKQYIARFSEWEKLIVLLAQQKENQLDQQSLRERMLSSLRQNLSALASTGDIERYDAENNGWLSPVYQAVTEACRLTMPDEELLSAFTLLSECRDLIQIYVDTVPSGRTEAGGRPDWLEGRDEALAQLFFRFVLCLSARVLQLSPKIDVFFPAGRFVLMNFYSVRFVDATFRSSVFWYSVFARSKLKDSNLSMSRFEQCEFFSADCRDCSFGNSDFRDCRLRDAIFENVDFTGATLQNCDLTGAAFHDSILINLELGQTRLGGNDFTSCKLSGIQIRCQGDDGTPFLAYFPSCNFSDSSLTDIFLIPAVSPPPFPPAAGPVSQAVAAADQNLQHYFLTARYNNPLLHRRLRTFSLAGNPYDEIQPWDTRAQRLPTHPVWRYIKESALISLRECVFNNAMMPAFHFYRTRMNQSVFLDTQLAEAMFFCVYMPGCIMTGANLREASLLAVSLKSAILTDAILFHADCRLVNFEDASLENLHASRAAFHACTFCRSDCSEIDLTRARICHSSFQDAILTHAELTGTLFADVHFETCSAEQLLASYATFKDCEFANASLRASSFNCAVFENCSFQLADFSGSTFTNTTFRHCDFSDSRFHDVCFVQAKFENCDNLKTELFQQSRFIDPEFLGACAGFARELEKLDQTTTPQAAPDGV